MPLRKANGKWHWRFQIDGIVYRGGTGLAANARNRTAALRMEAEARRTVLEGRSYMLKVIQRPFSDAAEAFLTWAEGEHQEHPQTARRLAVSFASCKTFFGDQPVHSITAGHLEDYKSWRRREHQVRDVTLRHDLHALSKFFKYAVKHTWCCENPVQQVKIPSDAEAQRMHVLTPSEEFQYFEAAKRFPNLHDLGRVMIRQGMRPEEIMGMAQVDVDLEAGTIGIPRGKSRAARRILHIPPDGEVQRILGKRLDGGLWVFPGKKKGTHLSKLNGSHNKILAATGLKFVLYDLRHTFATRMAERGMDLATLASILGHSNLRSVMRYVHPTREHQRAAMHRYGVEKPSRISTPEEERVQ